MNRTQGNKIHSRPEYNSFVQAIQADLEAARDIDVLVGSKRGFDILLRHINLLLRIRLPEIEVR
jgi:hypothetical protein